MWFCVSALSVSEHVNDPPTQQRLWEEHLFLVDAASADEAHTKAEKIARGQECSYESANQSKVSWKFERISKVYKLDGKPTDGSEVFSRFLKESEVQSILSPMGN
jgi:hypothetical protein